MRVKKGGVQLRQLNGIYTQAYNRRHGKVGHLFQGRYKAILVDRDAYLLAVCRYVELNPVRAKLVVRPGDWVWSSYLAHCCDCASPAWLDTAGLHGFLLGADAVTAEQRLQAVRRYVELVEGGRDSRLWDESLRQQIYLGDEAFIERMQVAATLPFDHPATDVPKAQRNAPKTAWQWLQASANREEALWLAHTRSGITMSALAAELGLSVARVSQLIKRHEGFKLKA